MKARYVCATAIYCGIIFLMSSRSDPPTPDWEIFFFPAFDKIAHALLYGGLAATVSIGLWRSNGALRPALHFGIPIVFSVLYGFSDEIHQIFVPERTFEFMDLLADGIGATIVQVALCAYMWPSGARETRAPSPPGE